MLILRALSHQGLSTLLVFFFFFETGSFYVAQAGLELLGSVTLLPQFPSAGTPAMCHHAQLTHSLKSASDPYPHILPSLQSASKSKEQQITKRVKVLLSTMPKAPWHLPSTFLKLSMCILLKSQDILSAAFD
jgi:hypothetical protein